MTRKEALEMPVLVLASASPRRRDLLRSLGLEFVIDPAHIDESESPGAPDAIVLDLARRKARESAPRHKNSLIVGCDTLVFLDGRSISKPTSPEQAMQFLTALSGRTHSVWSAIAVLQTDGQARIIGERSAARETRVTMRALAAAQIQAYVASGEPMDKAGAYGIQGLGALLIDSIEGDFFNVVGLPLTLLSDLLGEFGVNLMG